MSDSFTKSVEDARARVKQFEQRATGMLKMPIGGDASGGLVDSGSLLGLREARDNELALDQFKNWVYTCVNAIAKRGMQQPWIAARDVDAGPNVERSTKGSGEAAERLRSLKAYKSAIPENLELLSAHPALDTLWNPNEVQGKAEFIYMVIANLEITGEAYIVSNPVTRDGKTRIELWALPTAWVIPDHSKKPFGAYKIQINDRLTPVPVKAENVARIYLPDPKSIKGCYSPLRAVADAVLTDDHIQSSQLESFETGINPNVIITIAKRKKTDGTEQRPILDGAQRRQIIQAIREIWDQTASGGDPAIIDGLIESIHKLQNTPQEMDWPGSGEIVKRRIMQAYGVNPIIVGEITPSNKAQAVVAEQSFCENVVNPILESISVAITGLLGPKYTVPERLELWLAPCVPQDAESDLKKWGMARKNGDVSRDEFRAKILGLPPTGDGERNPLAISPAGVNSVITMLEKVGMGAIPRESAIATLVYFYGLTQREAAALLAEKPPETPPDEPDDVGESEGEDNDGDALGGDEADYAAYNKALADDIDLSVTDGMKVEAERGLKWREQYGRGGTRIGARRARQIINDGKLTPATWRRVKAYFDRHQPDQDAMGFRPGEEGYPSNGRIAWALWGGDAGYQRAKAVVRRLNAQDERDAEYLEKLTKELAEKNGGMTKEVFRELYKTVAGRSFANAERRLGRKLAQNFRSVTGEMEQLIRRDNTPYNPGDAEAIAENIMDKIWRQNGDRWSESIIEDSAGPLLRAFLHGAYLEIEAAAAVVDMSKRTSAEELLAELDIELPDGIGVGELPAWLRQAATEELAETFREDYWQRIHATTRYDIQTTLTRGIEEGLSSGQVADIIAARHGAEYSRARAMNVARTETGNMLNAGHAAGISQLSEETGLDIRKEWVSVLGSTTRPEHAGIDGVESDEKGLFVLDGTPIPWPSHRSLPARHRCNCQCSVISSAVMDELSLPKFEPEKPEDDKPKKPGEIPHFSRLRFVETLGGSTGAKKYEDEDGNFYVVKRGSSEGQLRDEYAAEKLYETLGVPMIDSVLQKDEGGELLKVSRWKDGTLMRDLPEAEKVKVRRLLQKDYASDALLANWDVVGLSEDNVIVGEDGKPYRIDVGGSLRYRAQGDPKAERFTDNAMELWTLRDENLNPSGAKAFGEMTWAAQRASVRKTTKVSWKKIDEQLRELERQGLDTTGLRDKLKSRYESLKTWEATERDLTESGFKDEYKDRFMYHQANMAEAGVHAGLSKKLTWNGYEMVDENGKPFDHLRGEDSSVVKLDKYMSENRMFYGYVKEYLDGQSGDSWSDPSQKFKAHLKQSVKKPGDFWWRYRNLHGKDDIGPAYTETMIAYHAFTYETMRKVEVPGVNYKNMTVNAARTESDAVMQQYKLPEGMTGTLKRGIAESFSIKQTVTVYGNELTYQEMPLSSVFVFYGNGKDAGYEKDRTCLLKDGENEIVCMFRHGGEVYYDGSVYSRHELLTPEEWKKKSGGYMPGYEPGKKPKKGKPKTEPDTSQTQQNDNKWF